MQFRDVGATMQNTGKESSGSSRGRASLSVAERHS